LKWRTSITQFLPENYTESVNKAINHKTINPASVTKYIMQILNHGMAPGRGASRKPFGKIVLKEEEGFWREELFLS
jgi:hypothetical protein